MINWFVNNIGTILVAMLLIFVVAMISVKIVRDKRQGKSSCGFNCSHCSITDVCHDRKEN